MSTSTISYIVKYIKGTEVKTVTTCSYSTAMDYYKEKIVSHGNAQVYIETTTVNQSRII